MAQRVEAINYSPAPTISKFIKDYRPGALFYDWIVGPVGSAKTTGIFFKLIYMAKLQKPGPDGVRRSRAVVVRNTMPQLRDTTLVSWNYWFRDGQAGKWRASENKFTLRYDDVECEVLFRALDTPDDVARVLSLEVTFALLDEFVQIPRQIVEALSARLGRYPAAKDGGATNWGMWGSSNPDTEDCWWFDYLHEDLPGNATYFKQPGGMHADAENLENLPGQREYYVNQMIGKSEGWIKQFIDAEWGFSAEGQPVVGTFNADMHTTDKPILFDPKFKLLVGFDPGVGSSAAIFGQEDNHGRLRVLGELITEGFGAQRFVTDKLLPYINERFPDADIVLAPDPAAASRASTDERTVVDVLKRYFTVSVESNNRLPLRLNAIEYYSTRLTDVGPALLIYAPDCPVLVRALKGGWRFTIDQKKNIIKGAEPEKNIYSHPGDAFGYLCRYFHRGAERGSRYPKGNGKKFTPKRTFGAAYHVR